MVQVNSPFQLKIPDEFLKNNDTRNFFEKQQFTLWQLWLRTGGGSDSVTGNEGFVEVSGVSNVDELVEELINKFQQQSIPDERIDDLEVLSGITPRETSDRVELVYVNAPDANYDHLEDDDVVYLIGTNDFNFLSQAQAYKNVTVKNEGVGTITMVPDGSETAEITSLTPGESITFGPRGTGFSWSVLG